MEPKNPEIESLLDSVSDYGKTSYELIQLKSIDKLSDCVSSFMSHLIVCIPTSIAIIFINLSASIWLGEYLKSNFYGFLSVAVFNGLIACFILVFMRKWFKQMIYDAVIVFLLKK